MDEEPLKLVRLLIARLERISADSYWAHRASGVRGSLLRLLDEIDDGLPQDPVRVAHVIKTGFDVLAQAAKSLL